MVRDESNPLAPPEALPVARGDVIAGKYRVKTVIGAGGMAVVVSAQHLQLDRVVAIKVLLPRVMSDASAVERFRREAQAVSRVKSEHVARVIDVGALPNGIPYMVMEYLEGCDLAQLLGMQGALPMDVAIEYLLQACDAVADAHACGIVHRDLKPSNLYLSHRPDGSPVIKVLDFGISKSDTAGDRLSASITQTSIVMGSPMYMSPEQLRSARKVDSRTDIWALGVILFEILTNHHAFDEENVSGVYAAIASDPAPVLRQFRPDAPVELERVILKCLEKDPANRYQSVVDLAKDLLPFATGASPWTRAAIERIAGLAHAPVLFADNSAVRTGPRKPAFPAHATLVETPPPRGRWWIGALVGSVVIGGALLAVAVGGVGRGRRIAASPEAPAAAASPSVVAESMPSAGAPSPGVEASASASASSASASTASASASTAATSRGAPRPGVSARPTYRPPNRALDDRH